MNEGTDIDKFFDQADADHAKQKRLEARIQNPIVRSYGEFLDKDGKVKDRSPFYVVVHKDEVDMNREIDEETRKKLSGEIDFIESNFDHTSAGPFEIASGVPYGRPVIVCGAYDAVCVGQQHDLLIKGGYDAYISKEGTLPFKPNHPAFGQSTK